MTWCIGGGTAGITVSRHDVIARGELSEAALREAVDLFVRRAGYGREVRAVVSKTHGFVA
jgi:hypothetical protein